MIKKTLFSINYYLKEDFINQSEIDKICDSIDKNSLIDYDYIQGNAKTSMGANQNQFLDFHKDLEDKTPRTQAEKYRFDLHGFTLKEANEKVGELITKVIKGLSENPNDNSKIEEEVRNDVINLCSSFPIYKNLNR